jgi:peroxiredoxin Q/BCP
MPVELRKRKAPENASTPIAKKASSIKEKVKAAITGNKDSSSASTETNGGAAASKKITVGETVSLDDFGGEIETEAGEKTSLKKLIEASSGGVVLFTYPKASTPGCK